MPPRMSSVEPSTRRPLKKEALVIGYAMSRLDRKYLASRGLSTWTAAYREAAYSLNTSPSNPRLLRDEFDPVHAITAGRRKGWQREMRQGRLEIVKELSEESDEALMALVDSLLRGDRAATREVVESIVRSSSGGHNVAERLLTGRRAEEFFMTRSQELVEVPRKRLVDYRGAAAGFDFGDRAVPATAVEVKGLKERSGEIQFTDHEWSTAQIRRDDYWLVVVGNLATNPVATVLRNPGHTLSPRCFHQATITALWRSPFRVA